MVTPGTPEIEAHGRGPLGVGPPALGPLRASGVTWAPALVPRTLAARSRLRGHYCASVSRKNREGRWKLQLPGGFALDTGQ